AVIVEHEPNFVLRPRGAAHGRTATLHHGLHRVKVTTQHLGHLVCRTHAGYTVNDTEVIVRPGHVFRLSYVSGNALAFHFVADSRRGTSSESGNLGNGLGARQSMKLLRVFPRPAGAVSQVQGVCFSSHGFHASIQVVGYVGDIGSAVIFGEVVNVVRRPSSRFHR